jgi:hypothetical protein
MPRAKGRKRIELTVPGELYDQIQADAATAGVSATEWLLTGRGYNTQPRYKFPNGAANPSAQAAKEGEVQCPECKHFFHQSEIVGPFDIRDLGAHQRILDR